MFQELKAEVLGYAFIKNVLIMLGDLATVRSR